MAELACARLCLELIANRGSSVLFAMLGTRGKLLEGLQVSLFRDLFKIYKALKMEDEGCPNSLIPFQQIFLEDLRDLRIQQSAELSR